MRQRGGGSERIRGNARKERPAEIRTQRKRAPFNTLGARRDGQGRRGLRRLVEESNECNESDEQEGAEARRAVRRLVRRYRSSEHAVAACGSVGPLCHCGVVTGASSLAGAAAAVACSVFFLSLAGFWWVFCFVLETLACFEAADFFTSSFAFTSALIFFAAWIVSSFAASSASKDWFWKLLGMSEVMPKVAE